LAASGTGTGTEEEASFAALMAARLRLMRSSTAALMRALRNATFLARPVLASALTAAALDDDEGSPGVYGARKYLDGWDRCEDASDVCGLRR